MLRIVVFYFPTPMNYLALINYIIVMSVTPGPNNLILAATGVNFGLKRSLPMCAGIIIGSCSQCILALSTFHLLFNWVQELRFPLAVLGCSYLLWLSWKLYRSTFGDDNGSVAKPMTLWQMALFQWINPKAWLMAINIAILFSSPNSHWTDYVVITLLNGIALFPCIFIWAALGSKLKHFLHNPQQLQRFNTIMALLMGITALWLLTDETFFFFETHTL